MKSLLSLSLILALSSCQLTGNLNQGQDPSPKSSNSPTSESEKPTPAASPTTEPQNDNAPIIQSANANPRVIASSSDVITFTINAFSPINSPMELTWTATKGFMSSTKGESVQWYPVGADGKAQAGPAVITCTITDTKNNQKKIDFNILILPSGGAELQGEG